MANWYVSSVAYAAIAAFQTGHAYSVGDIIRPTAAAAARKQAYRCTTAGTSAGSEPTWTSILGSTTTSNTAVFTAVNSDTYGWAAAAGDLKTVFNDLTTGYAALGDKVFVSSDHAETTAAAVSLGSFITGTWGTATTHVLSVSRAGSVPPVAADVTTGATVTVSSGQLTFDAAGPMRFEGVSFVQSSANNIVFNSSKLNSVYFKNCLLSITSATSGLRITATGPASVTLDNTPVSFANAGQAIGFGNYSLDFKWINTASPLAGTAPTSLIIPNTSGAGLFIFRGIDLSSFTGNLFATVSGACFAKILLDSCKVSASATLFSGTSQGQANVIELVNCWDGTNVINSRTVAAGAVTTERTIVLASGATDDIGAFSLKMVTNSTKLDKFVDPLDSFWFDVENTSTGSSKTATVEIVSSASLNNDEIWLELEYMGASGTPLATIANSLPTTVLTSAAAVTSSAASWSSSPATPVYQKLQLTFTPQRAGRVRARVMLGKASTTVYVNPKPAIT
jgi:hypothetical protein